MHYTIPLIIFTLCLLSVPQAASVEMPVEVIKAEAKHLQNVDTIVEAAKEDIAKSEERLLKTLEREIKSAQRTGDHDLVVALQDRISELKGEPKGEPKLEEKEFESDAEKRQHAINTLFGQSQPLKQDHTIPLILDDVSRYKWNGGSPKVIDDINYEGEHAFLPTGNNHTNIDLDEPAIIGAAPGQVHSIRFYVYLPDTNRSLLFQAQVGKAGWNNRVAMDGRAQFNGKLKWPFKSSILNLQPKTWHKIEINFAEYFQTPAGTRLTAIAFSAAEEEAIIYDHVELLVND